MAPEFPGVAEWQTLRTWQIKLSAPAVTPDVEFPKFGETPADGLAPGSEATPSEAPRDRGENV